jgi:diguanylate cyclase (GGDEF)-like protein
LQGLNSPLTALVAAVNAAALGRVFQASPTPTIVTDDDLRIVAANAAFERLSGMRQSEWLGAVPPVTEAHGGLATFRAALAGPHGNEARAACQVTLHRQDGSHCRAWMSWARARITRGAGCLYVATFFELDADDGDIDLWRHRAHHDALTGLANREHLAAEIERGLARAARHGHRLALLFIDLDGFKSLNDGLGHAAGDRLLADVGRCLRQTMRAEDFVARFGGDEFVVLVEAPRHAGDAASAAEAVITAIARLPVPAGIGEARITASVGIAMYPEHASDAAGLLEVADAAMYRAKRAGGNGHAIGDVAPATRSIPRQAA